MATKRAKKVFETEELTQREKIVANRLSISHTLTNDGTPASNIENLKIFIIGVAIVDMLMSAGQYDIIFYLFQFLTMKDFVHLAAAANSSILPTFWTPTSSIFKRLSKKLFFKFNFHDRPDSNRLATFLSGIDLLREYRVLKKPKLDWKIDASVLLPNGHITSVAFNPVHPMVAITLAQKIYILAYGGQVRAIRGQILFGIDKPTLPVLFVNINWSPTGKYLLCIMGQTNKEPYQITIIQYNEKTLEMHEIDFGSEGKFLGAPGLNSKYLWLDENSFLFVTTKEFNLTKIKLLDENKFKKTNIDLSSTMNEIKFLKRRTLFLPPFIGPLFVMPDPFSPYIFFLTSCAENHQHHRILYIDKMTRKISKVVNVPGEIAEISVANEYFLIVVQDRSTESFDKDCLPSISNIVDKKFKRENLFSSTTPEAQHSCPFPPPERSSSFDFDNNTGRIMKCTNDSVCNFRKNCCEKLEGIASSLSPDSNKKLPFLLDQLNTICMANSLFTTTDYIYFVNKMAGITYVLGANHHFSFKTEWDEDYIFTPAIRSVAWFHPLSHIFLRRKTSHYFEVFLTRIATDDDRKNFPKMVEFAYKKKISFSPQN
jgi:hypothetical protein